MNAKVWLVGAGPGDPELLTLKAVRALQQAAVVMIDDLVNPAVLEHCPQARVIAVGKRGGCRSTPQAFIQRLMLRHARQGRCVVRLKGGDPCIFGRGGEEALWLQGHGIEVELVNGITAGLAGATQCGISLTSRGVSRRGDAGDGAHPGRQRAELDRSGTGRDDAGGLHGGGAAGAGTPGLAGGGMAPGLPVAMIENASMPQQRECRSDVLGMVEDARMFGLRSPAILVIGEVVGEQQALELVSIAG